MGPCRIKPKGPDDQSGCCGADRDTIVARNLARAIAGGAAAHSDHGRGIAKTLLLAAKGEAPDFILSNTDKLTKLAEEFGINTDDLSVNQIAEKVAEFALSQFGQQEDSLIFINRAPENQQKSWKSLGVTPRGIDREIVETMHRTHEGVDIDYKNIIQAGIKCALGDGWGGSMLATEISDILFGSPCPVRSTVNLGVIEKNKVNIIVHGHEPSLSEMLVRAAKDKEIIEYCKEAGAEGVNLAGICCTANEILMRQGMPIAGNFLQQELAIITGAVEAMAVDVQCVLPSLKEISSCYHTKLFTTSKKAKMPGVEHIEFSDENARNVAKEIIKKAIENFKNRNPDKINIPDKNNGIVAGFTTENIFHHLGGTFRGTYRPLNDAIMDGRIRGVAAVVGCNTTKIVHDYAHLSIVKELIKNDVLVVQTGCAAIACAKAGLLQPEAAFQFAGKGLQEVCEAVGIPPVLHMGSCVDNSRILIACCEMVNEGGIGEDISRLPVVAVAPEAMSEKAVSIAFYAAASGVFTVFAPPPRIMGSTNVLNFICDEMEDVLGGKFAFISDPEKSIPVIINHINSKRDALKLKPMMYE